MLIVCCRSLILIVLEKFSMDVPCFCCFAPSSMCTHHYFTTHACHIAPAAQIQPTQYLANTPAAVHDFFRLLSSSSDDDSISL
ncbi:hypothetical protein CISIN_1g034825mg [Citrus sinensis]|uniref:Secreted protein n=1 Tax=Citrus sinensis TaxID=2711 RepID=A0A067DB94_CITSI|nr:hypothetical protein CISIN_1g034825mg [Citrus sinensis]